MASPFADVANATATFTLPTAGTTTDALGNVIAATESVTATLFLKGRQEVSAGTPGTEGTLSTLSGYAVDPMALDWRPMRYSSPRRLRGCLHGSMQTSMGSEPVSAPSARHGLTSPARFPAPLH